MARTTGELRSPRRHSPPAGDRPDRPGAAAPLVLHLLPPAVMAIVAIVDVATGPDTGFLPLVSLGPAFAGLTGTWRRAVAFGVVALLLCAVLGAYDGLLQTRRGCTAMASVAGVTLAGTLAGVARRRREAELARVRSVAEAAQRVLLRPVPARAGHLRAAVTYTSATAEARIGGDLYEVVVTPRAVRVIVGDVQGKGLEAVDRAAVALGAFREAAHDGDIVTVGHRVQRAMAREGQDDKFVTALLAEFTPGEGARFVNYGHPAPMLVRADGTVEFPEPARFALPLGLLAHGAEGPEPFRVDFGPGDQVLLYTDGVTEARDARGAFYPLGARAARLLDHPDPSAALAGLRADLQRHIAGPFRDDAAMLLLRCGPSGPHGGN